MVKKSETKAKTKAKDENSTSIVNSLLFFMNQRHKSTGLDSTFKMMLNFSMKRQFQRLRLCCTTKLLLKKD